MKRFTATEKWEDPWFRALQPIHKLLFLWLVDKCDNAGVIEPDLSLAAFQLGMKVTEETLAPLSGRVVRLQNRKLYLPKFITFQYGELSRECKAHNPVFKSLEANGLLERGESQIHTLWIPLTKGMDTVQEKDKVQEQEKETDVPVLVVRESKAKCTIEQAREFAVSIGLHPIDGEHCFWKWEGNGWTNNKTAIKDWKATIRNWKTMKILPSQKPDFTPPVELDSLMAEPEYDFQGTWASTPDPE